MFFSWPQLLRCSSSIFNTTITTTSILLSLSRLVVSLVHMHSQEWHNYLIVTQPADHAGFVIFRINCSVRHSGCYYNNTSINGGSQQDLRSRSVVGVLTEPHGRPRRRVSDWSEHRRYLMLYPTTLTQMPSVANQIPTVKSQLQTWLVRLMTHVAPNTTCPILCWWCGMAQHLTFDFNYSDDLQSNQTDSLWY